MSKATLLSFQTSPLTDSYYKELNDYCEKESYLLGASPSQDDVFIFDRLESVSSNLYPHASRWLNHIGSFPLATRKNWKRGSLQAQPKEAPKPAVQKPVKEATKTPAPTPSPDEEDDIDLFGEIDEDEKKEAEKVAEAKKSDLTKKKKVVIEKSSLVIEVHPSDSEVNLEEVFQMIVKMQIPGLKWGEGFKKEPLVFGLYKLLISCVIIDEEVDTTGVVEKLEALGMNDDVAQYLRYQEAGDEIPESLSYLTEEAISEAEESRLIQSAAIISFNKI